MKTLFLTIALSLAAISAEASNVVCALKESADPKNYSSVKIDLGKALEEAYNDDKGVSVERDHFSFTVYDPALEGKQLTLNVIFTENNHVEDEVANMTWEVDLAKAVKGQPILQEPLNWGPDETKIMDFVCYYNQ